MTLPTTQLLADGSTGWFIRWRHIEGPYWEPRHDDCQAAALATVLQVPIDELPDPRIDERLAAGEDVGEIDRTASAELARWLADRGLRVVVHRKLPLAEPRWLGVCPMPGLFQNHCLVMAGNTLLFDPATVCFPGQTVLRRWCVGDIAAGYSFRPISVRGGN